MNKVAIYARVSTSEQAEHGYSINEQLDKIKAYCISKDWSVYNEYVDAGFSGSKLERPAIQKLITDSNNKLFDTVVVYKLDRLSRNLQDALYLIKDVFDKNNVTFASLQENLDLSTASGQLNFNMFASFAEFERANIRERMSMGKVGRAKSGKPTTWNQNIFGYNYIDGELKIDEINASIVKRIYRDYLDGYSYFKICTALNNEGHIGKKQPWRVSSVRQVLVNKAYAGYNKYLGNYYKGNQENIISLEMWEQVQKELEIRQKQAYSKYGETTKRPFQSKYMLSGLLRCGECGASLYLMQTHKTKAGTRKSYYRCSTLSKKKSFSNWRADNCNQDKYLLNDLENEILMQLEKIHKNPSVLDSVSQDNNLELKKEIIVYNNKIVEANTKNEKLLDLYLDNKIALNIYETKKDELDNEVKSLTLMKNKLESNIKIIDSSKAKDLLTNIENSIFDLNYENQKIIVRKLIHKITVKDDEIKIFWNFE